MQAHIAYTVKSWGRKAWNDDDTVERTGAKLARIEMIHTYDGDMIAEGRIQYLFAENSDGKGSFVALEKIIGNLGDKSGSFVWQRTGTFDHGKIKEVLVVLSGSGEGELVGLSGEAMIAHDQHQEIYTFHFEYTIGR